MPFTALHRLLGLAPGPFTDEMIDAAVASGLAETDDLDWKAQLPQAKDLKASDFAKDIAAMANSGGGVIVYGVDESQKAASRRRDVGELPENYARTMRQLAVAAITPPVFNLDIELIGKSGNQVLVVSLPPSVDGPHLIYRDQFFGAPFRINADTGWMRERQLEGAYRVRLEQGRRAAAELLELHQEAKANWTNPSDRVWLIAVARPRSEAVVRGRLQRIDARSIFQAADAYSDDLTAYKTNRPLDNMERLNLRPGLRRWVAFNFSTAESAKWRAAWAAVHDNGSVSLASALGGARQSRDGYALPSEVESRGIEAAVADTMSLIRATSRVFDTAEYEISIHLEWDGPAPIKVLTVDGHGQIFGDNSAPIHRYAPVSATVAADATWPEFHRQAHDLAMDCINQGGISNLHLIPAPAEDEGPPN